MKRIFEYVGLFIIIAFLSFPIIYFNNYIGTFKSNIEKTARSSQKIDINWEVAKSTTESMSAMLFYDKDMTDHTFSIYVNRKGLSFGYFFRGGGSTFENEYIVKYTIERYRENAYLSMNHQQILKVEIDNGNAVEIINIDPTKPFAIILPHNIDTIRFYDINNQIVEPIPYQL